MFLASRRWRCRPHVLKARPNGELNIAVKHHPTLFYKTCLTMLDDVLRSLISVKYPKTFLLFPSLMNNVWFVWTACKTFLDSRTRTRLSLNNYTKGEWRWLCRQGTLSSPTPSDFFRQLLTRWAVHVIDGWGCPAILHAWDSWRRRPPFLFNHSCSILSRWTRKGVYASSYGHPQPNGSAVARRSAD